MTGAPRASISPVPTMTLSASEPATRTGFGATGSSWKWESGPTSGASATWSRPDGLLAARAYSSPALLGHVGYRHARERVVTGRCNMRLHDEHSILNRRNILTTPPRVHMAERSFGGRETMLKPVVTPRPLTVHGGDRTSLERKRNVAAMLMQKKKDAVPPRKVDFVGYDWTAPGEELPEPDEDEYRKDWEFQVDASGRMQIVNIVPIVNESLDKETHLKQNYPLGTTVARELFPEARVSLFDATKDRKDWLAWRKVRGRGWLCARVCGREGRTGARGARGARGAGCACACACVVRARFVWAWGAGWCACADQSPGADGPRAARARRRAWDASCQTSTCASSSRARTRRARARWAPT